MKLLFGILIPLAALAQQAAIAVVEKKAGTVAFYDAANKRLGEVRVGSFPHETAFSLDRKLLYVTDNGLLWMTDPGDGVNSISIIDLASRKKTGVIDLGQYRRPHGIQTIPQSGHLLTTIENPFGLLLVDPAARKVLRKFDVKGKNPHMVTLGPGAERAYVSNAGSNAIAVLNLKSGAVEKLIPTGENPQGGVLARDGKLYVTVSAADYIAVIDTAKNEEIGRIKTGVNPARIALTPDEKTLVYNLQRGEGVGFADVAGRKQTGEIRVPGRPLSLALSRDGKIAYLGLQDSDKIAIVSVGERKIQSVIESPKGAGPDTITPLP